MHFITLLVLASTITSSLVGMNLEQLQVTRFQNLLNQNNLQACERIIDHGIAAQKRNDLLVPLVQQKLKAKETALERSREIWRQINIQGVAGVACFGTMCFLSNTGTEEEPSVEKKRAHEAGAMFAGIGFFHCFKNVIDLWQDPEYLPIQQFTLIDDIAKLKNMSHKLEL